MSWGTNWDRICSVDGCGKLVRSKGFCNNHYARFWRNGTTEKLNGDKRNHPLYIIWWQRKQDKVLCETWLDFNVFIKDVEPRPDENHFLVRLRNELFGPDNFKWQEHLKRKDGESKSDWWARKRASRIAANPAMESDRNIKRKYNLNREQYDEKLRLQNFGCAICGEKEKAFDGRTGSIRCLAVDHNHITGKVRGLLCWRCNGTIGKLNEHIELLDKMKQYLLMYKD